MKTEKNPIVLIIVLAAVAVVGVVLSFVLDIGGIGAIVAAAGAFGCAFFVAKKPSAAGADTQLPVDENGLTIPPEIPSAKPVVTELTDEEKEIAEEMKQAMADGVFTIYYQTKVNIVTGRIVGLEALIRWPHPEKGMIPPMKFLPVAEKTGYVVEIGKWVTEQVCSHLRDWKAKGLKLVPVAINFSRTELYQPAFIDNLKKILDRYGVRPKMLELEISEQTAITDYIFFDKLINRMTEEGFIIAIDDFGSEQENLQRLQSIPCDAIKFDRDFVQKIQKETVSKATVKQIMDLARAVGIDVVCEGVETQEQVDVLLDNNCNVAQGYFFSFPTRWQDATEFLQ